VSVHDPIWPKDAPKADPSKLIEVLDEQVRELKRDYGTAQQILDVPSKDVSLRDMPDGVLDGRLGELCSRRLAAFPLAYSWPTMLAAASVLIDRRNSDARVNLYCGIIGPVHSGKSQAIEHANKTLGVEAPALLDLMSGSAEQLLRRTKDAAGNSRLFSPDELGHLLEKAQIDRSSFPYILNRAFYADKFEVLLGKKETVTFNCALSIVGGIVEERFQDLFNASTTAGLYDRFLFAACPGDYVYDYFPFAGVVEPTSPVCVLIDPEVWYVKKDWLAADREMNPRVAEIAIRAATVCAAFNGSQLLIPSMLGPARELARYQTNIRKLLKPNAGQNFEARLAHKFLAYLERHGGRFVSRRELFRATRAYDLGPSTADRALSVLHANGDIEVSKAGKQELVRILAECDAASPGANESVKEAEEPAS
jgi:hypothetical protein